MTLLLPHQQIYCQTLYLPSNIGPNSNWRKCGSKVALRNPIDALVAQIPTAHTTTPGIFRTDLMFAVENYKNSFLISHFHLEFCTYVPSVLNHILEHVLVTRKLLTMLLWVRLIRGLQMVSNILQPSIMYLQPSVQRLILIRKRFPAMPGWRNEYTVSNGWTRKKIFVILRCNRCEINYNCNSKQ